MLAFLLKRLATLVPTLIGITIVAFGLIRLVPGDPIEVMMGERRLDPETHAALVKRMGLDQPLPVQYFDYVGKLLQGDLGQSLVSREPVSKEFVALFPDTRLDAAYAVLQSHDVRFDGRLFVGVTSTGIYCRPVCRVRLPRRENCRFFSTAAQAEAERFRPCMKCRPELAPRALPWTKLAAPI